MQVLRNLATVAPVLGVVIAAFVWAGNVLYKSGVNDGRAIEADYMRTSYERMGSLEARVTSLEGEVKELQDGQTKILDAISQ